MKPSFLQPCILFTTVIPIASNTISSLNCQTALFHLTFVSNISFHNLSAILTSFHRTRGCRLTDRVFDRVMLRHNSPHSHMFMSFHMRKTVAPKMPIFLCAYTNFLDSRVSRKSHRSLGLCFKQTHESTRVGNACRAFHRLFFMNI